MVFILYAAIFFLGIFGLWTVLCSIPQALFSAIPIIGSWMMIIAGFFLSFGVAYLWGVIMDINIPMGALFALLIGYIIFYMLQKEDLNLASKASIEGELIGVIIFIGYYWYKTPSINWV